ILLLNLLIIPSSLEQSVQSKPSREKSTSATANGSSSAAPFSGGIANARSGGGSNVEEFNPTHPKVRCDYLPLDFLECDRLVDHFGNVTARDKHGFGCVKWGGEWYEEWNTQQRSCNAWMESNVSIIIISFLNKICHWNKNSKL
ncbi:TM2 domain-containing protein 2, partial [Orchesella cincta]